MQTRLIRIAVSGVLFAAPMAAAQPTVGTGSTPVPSPTATAPEGCAQDIAQQCSSATTASAQSQCLTGNISTVSEACRAAMAQNPPPGMTKSLGNDPAPSTTPPPAQPVNLPGLVPPPTQTTAARPIPAPPPLVGTPPMVVLAPPISTVLTPVPVTTPQPPVQ